ncbi:TetR/AcrR family transcriptional regulator [Lysinibacillus piscis]|uniref:TetR family transcriptional regulator n=1 Tax=Lysinibacillus piscis TaxID=2518931 RepID=A0ABQ5NFM6_9BACI|nr:TetR-like C-terminal domain-containing protein [Lysinibacillus sp. KH24]GLC87174.1 TetR family transcriptional regulator [Lysinibacillus sp. KH24]
MSIHEQMNSETKQAIRQALVEQMQTVPFEQITVKNLALTANINRGTFYLHYMDKFEVMEDLQQQLLQELASCVQQVQPVEAFQTIQKGQLYQPFVGVITYIKKQDKAFRVLLGANGSQAFSHQMKNVFSNHLLDKVMALQVEAFDSEFRSYLQAFLTSAILGVIQQWLENGNEDMTVEEMVMMHFRLLRFISSLGFLR